MQWLIRLRRDGFVSRGPLILLGAFCLLGAALAVYGTANGPWGRSDSAAYLAAARSLASGRGLGFPDSQGNFQFLTHYPPLYSLLLAFFYFLGGDLLATPRWLDVFFYAGTILGCGIIFIRFSRSPWLGPAAAILVGAFPMTVRMSHAAMSEPLFLFLLVWAGYALLSALQSDRRGWAAAALLAGLLPLVRYVGVAFLLAGVVALLWLSPGGWRVRFGRALRFGLVACLPLLVWLGWAWLAVGGDPAGRTFQVVADGLGEKFRLFVSLFAKVMWEWLPYHPLYPPTRSRLRFALFLLGGLTVAALAFLARWRARRAEGAEAAFPIFAVFTLASLSYALTLLAAYLFTDPVPDVDDRMLLPFYLSLVLSSLGAVALWQSAWQSGRRWLAALPWLATVVFLIWWFPQNVYYVCEDHAGWGVTIYAWRGSPTLQALDALPADRPVVSDDAALILLWTGRPVYDLTATLRPDFIAGQAVYGSDPSDPAQRAFCQAGAPLVLFGDLSTWLETASGAAGRQRLTTLLALPGTEYADGEIYYCELP